jgi:hypothetical protein
VNETQILTSNRDALLVAIPFVTLLFISVFRLDQLVSMPKAKHGRRRPVGGTDQSGQPILCDPDGRIAGTNRQIIPSRPKFVSRIRIVEVWNELS